MEHKIKQDCRRVFLMALVGFLSFFTLSAQSGSITVNGTVRDAKGESVIGATIAVAGTTTGSITDLDGNFTVNAPADGILEISYLGYVSQAIPVQNRTSIDIILREDTELLDEVVVIGYGTVRKSDATGSVAAIGVDELNKGVVTTPQELLSGKIAGVNVISEGGAPGSKSNIRIRGGSSLNASNDPLIIIDGMIISNDLSGSSNFLSTVNPNDIETFTVLKDASATAIYGSRASNGVILITTKKGMRGEGSGSNARVTYNGNFSVSTKRNSVDVMDGKEYREFIKDRFAGASNEETVLSKLGNYNTNWQDEIFQTAYSTDHNVSVYGYTQNVPYRVSLGYTNQEGILTTSKMERVTGSVSLTPNLFNDHLKLNINGKGMYSENRFAELGAVGSAVSFDPTQPVSNGSKWGGYFAWTNSEGELSSIAGKNPMAMLKMQNHHANVRNFIGNFQADYIVHFLPELRLNLNLGVDVAQTYGVDFKHPFNPSAYSESDNTSGSRKYFENFKNNQLLEFYAQYVKDVSPIRSRFDVMGGYSWQHYKKSNDEDLYYVSKEDLSDLDPIRTDSQYNFSEYYLVSFFGRFNYTFNDRYLLTFTLRDDGTSRFHPDNRWGLFPSLALAWRMKDETFLRDVNAVSDMKLRLGWGETGQQDITSLDNDYPYMLKYKYGKGQAYYPIGRDQNGEIIWVNLLRPDGVNENIKWETTTTWNVGLDYGFLNNRITGAVDVYFRKTRDLINWEAPVVTGTNFSERIIKNIGDLKNNGIEFSISGRPVVTKDLDWQVGFNIAYNKSKITRIIDNPEAGFTGIPVGSSGGDGGEYVQRFAEGYAPRTFFVYEQVYDANGKPIEGVYVDRNKDGVIDENDKYYHKHPDADVLMGFNSKVIFKNWDFGFNGRVSLGNYVYNAGAANEADIATSTLFANNLFLINRPKSALKSQFESKQALSDYYVQKASFLKIDNITLGYTFTGLFRNNTNARLYATVQNPVVITNYDGLDPEVFEGIDYNRYPRPLTFLFGINVNF